MCKERRYGRFLSIYCWSGAPSSPPRGAGCGLFSLGRGGKGIPERLAATTKQNLSRRTGPPLSPWRASLPGVPGVRWTRPKAGESTSSPWSSPLPRDTSHPPALLPAAIRPSVCLFPSLRGGRRGGRDRAHGRLIWPWCSQRPGPY